MKTQLQNTELNKHLLDLAYNFKDLVKAEGWVPRYDVETDSLSFSVKHLPDDARIRYFGNEIAFYVTSNNQIKGLFIEYFNSNFLNHAKKLAAVKKEIQKEIKAKSPDEDLIEVDKTKLEKSLDEFQNIIKELLAESMTPNKPFAY